MPFDAAGIDEVTQLRDIDISLVDLSLFDRGGFGGGFHLVISGWVRFSDTPMLRPE
jgi:hypothetical protein